METNPIFGEICFINVTERNWSRHIYKKKLFKSVNKTKNNEFKKLI